MELAKAIVVVVSAVFGAGAALFAVIWGAISEDLGIFAWGSSVLASAITGIIGYSIGQKTLMK